MADMGKVRNGAHDTEVEAAERVGLHLRESQQKVLDLLTEYGPMNDDKLRRMLSLKFGPQSKSGPATRRGELVDQGIVRKARDAEGNVVKAPSDAGGNMTVWERVPDGERVPVGIRPTRRRGYAQHQATDAEVASMPYGSVLVGFEGHGVAIKISGEGDRRFQVFYPDEQHQYPLTINYTHGKLTRIA